MFLCKLYFKHLKLYGLYVICVFCMRYIKCFMYPFLSLFVLCKFMHALLWLLLLWHFVLLLLLILIHRWLLPGYHVACGREWKESCKRENTLIGRAGPVQQYHYILNSILLIRKYETYTCQLSSPFPKLHM